VLLAAGKGTRLWPLTATQPKPALPVAGTPLVARLVEQAAEAGIERVRLVAAREDGPVARAAQRAAKAHGLDLAVHVQDQRRGTGHALAEAGVPDAPALVLYGDLFLPEGALASFVDAVGEAGVGARRVDDVSAYGALSVEDGRLAGLVEKPGLAEPGLVNAGVYVLPAGFGAHLDGLEESPRGELELTDALEASLDTGQAYDVHAFEAWQDVGWPWDLLEANARALDELEPATEGTVQEDAQLHGPVRVEAGATVREGSVLEGPVLVQAGATVGPNAYVRGATTIGPDAKIGHACEVKNTLLLEGANVPHVSYVGDSLLGREVNLGAGTQVANLRHDGATVQVETPRGQRDSGRRKLGVVLGDEVKTGINATLNAGVVLGPGETVKPGEAVYESRLGDG
jgi:bifunctional UDP-N-acetylglucosamine pyrophosphorylase/glucosamine-1-phosphate N-acetyltransferase